MKALIKYRGSYKYQLAETYTIKIPIRPRYSVVHDFLALDLSGVMTIKKGYCWDGCSGPTIDRKTTQRAGLEHDAGYQLIRIGVLPICDRAGFDRKFRHGLKTDGCWMLTQTAYYYGVKIGAWWAVRRNKDEVKILEAP